MGTNIKGVLYLAVQPQDIKRLNNFENDSQRIEYEPKMLSVKTEKGNVEALVYTYIDPTNLESFEWNTQYFLDTQYSYYQEQYKAKY